MLEVNQTIPTQDVGILTPDGARKAVSSPPDTVGALLPPTAPIT